MSERFHDGMTLREARDVLRALVDEGHKCPCCTQFAKVYKRKIHAQMARELITFARAVQFDPDRWVHLHDIGLERGGDIAKVRYWRLLEPDESARDDGSRRTGLWRVTDSGVAFVRNLATVPKYARLYDGRCLGFDGELVSIRDALGKRFNYAELMAGV